MKNKPTLHRSSFNPISMGSPSSATRFAANSLRYCSSSCSPSMAPPQPLVTFPVLYLCIVSLLFLVLVLVRIFVRPLLSEEEDLKSSLEPCFSRVSEGNSTRLPDSLLVELLPSNSPKWAALFSSVQEGDYPAVDGSGSGDSGGDGGGKRKKKRAKRKKKNQTVLNSGGMKSEDGGEIGGLGLKNMKSEDDLVCLYPFTSSSSATQRKIKQQYDQLVKSHDSKTLTLAEVGQFVNCLVDTRMELKQKSEMIQRKFTITKALLLRADRSSFDRLQKQLNKLELEQKRLEEDTFVYNWLQHQLKLSPAYKKIMDIGASLEAKAKSAVILENPDPSFTDISFEEFLAQEKKDSFWQKHSKLRSPPT